MRESYHCGVGDGWMQMRALCSFSSLQSYPIGISRANMEQRSNQLVHNLLCDDFIYDIFFRTAPPKATRIKSFDLWPINRYTCIPIILAFTIINLSSIVFTEIYLILLGFFFSIYVRVWMSCNQIATRSILQTSCETSNETIIHQE